jgi:hypothetical protein
MRLAHGRFLVAGVAALTLAAAAACGSSGSGGSAASPGPGTPTGSAVTSAPGGTGGTTTAAGGGATGTGSSGSTRPAGSTGAGAPGLRACPTSVLAADIVNQDNAAGHTDEQILFTNNGPSTCVLGGFPGVSYVDAAGHQIGAAAERERMPAPTVTLAPGRHAVAHLEVVHPGIAQGCQQASDFRPAASLRVYPPANREALLIATTGQQACVNPTAHQLTIGPVTRA